MVLASTICILGAGCQTPSVPTPVVVPIPTAPPVVVPIPTAPLVVVPIPTAPPVVVSIPTAPPVIVPIPTAPLVVVLIPTAPPVVVLIPTVPPVVVPIPTVPPVVVPPTAPPTTVPTLPAPISTPTPNWSDSFDRNEVDWIVSPVINNGMLEASGVIDRDEWELAACGQSNTGTFALYSLTASRPQFGVALAAPPLHGIIAPAPSGSFWGQDALRENIVAAIYEIQCPAEFSIQVPVSRFQKIALLLGVWATHVENSSTNRTMDTEVIENWPDN